MADDMRAAQRQIDVLIRSLGQIKGSQDFWDEFLQRSGEAIVSGAKLRAPVTVEPFGEPLVSVLKNRASVLKWVCWVVSIKEFPTQGLLSLVESLNRTKLGGLRFLFRLSMKTEALEAMIWGLLPLVASGLWSIG